MAARSSSRIMRALPEVREPFWKTFVGVAKTNPGALRYIVMLMALYLHLGPFSKHVIGEIDRRIAELDGMPPVRATGLSARARSVNATGNNNLSNESSVKNVSERRTMRGAAARGAD